MDQQRRDLTQYLTTAVVVPELERREWVESLAPPDVKPEELTPFIEGLGTLHGLLRAKVEVVEATPA